MASHRYSSAAAHHEKALKVQKRNKSIFTGLVPFLYLWYALGIFNWLFCFKVSYDRVHTVSVYYQF